jgi:diguanylate cyclase (GGDEF)-like protein
LQLFRTAARIFGIGAAASFFAGYLMLGRDLAKELPLTLIVLMFGVFIALIPHITKNHSFQNTLFLMVSILGQSYFIIANATKGAETLWGVYTIFLLYTVVLNSKLHANIFVAVTLVTQVVLAIMIPNAYATINRAQYFLRITIIILTSYGVRYLTREYAARMQGYRRFAKEQETLEKVSNVFVSVNRENVITKMDEMFRLTQERLGFDQAYLIEFSADYEDALIFSSYVVNESIPWRPGMKVKAAALPMAKTLIDQKQPRACENIENIADDEERNFFASRGINSCYAVPIMGAENITGMLVVEYHGKSDVRLSDNRLTFLGIVANILGDAKKKSLYEEELYNIAYFDENTKLANRNMLKSNIEKILHDRNESEKLVIFDIELDNLRSINDTYGHNAGEQVVIKVAAILKDMMRGGCTLARISQGKLVVVMPITETREQMEECARIITGAFSDPILPGEGIESLFVTASIGIAVYPDDGRDADTLLKNADLASYEARVSGNQVVFCTEQLKRRIENNTILTNRLFNSMKNEEFSLEFQPQVSCSTGKTVGVEALLRWTTVDNKRVGPDTFIPMLEQTGLIHDVGLWVLEQALREHNRLVSKGFPALRFSVNLSVVQFQKDDFVLNVTRIVEQSRVDPKYIELEITESMLSKNFSDSIQKLGQLKELGLNIAIDDFGKGYSSLHRLDMVPFNRIKIDKSIIDDIDFETKKSVIAKVIVSLARALMADITAEGVETKAQADFMKEISCDEIQGYLYSRPLSPEALEEFLKNEALRAEA